MRADISLNRFGWVRRLDYKKLIAIVFLLRLILASVYDIYITISDKDIIVPDSKFYSINGRYIDLVLQGYDPASFTWDLVPGDEGSRSIFFNELITRKGSLPTVINEPIAFAYVIGIIYFVLGYSTIWIRIFNICLSMLSVYLLFKVARRHFGDMAGNLFLLVALFLPTQFVYSITLSRDFLRVFVFSLTIWIVYNAGDVWTKRLRPRY